MENKKLKDTRNTKYKSRLESLRNEIVHLSNVTMDDRKPVKLDQTSVGRLSRMDALQSQAMHIETHRRRENELKRIEVALSKIQNGSFGECVTCGEEILKNRLDNDPTVLNCIECARVR